MPRFTISTGGIDRAGDSINPDGWRFDAFLKNPVVLWAHDAKALPVGKVTSITRTGDSVIADIAFDEADPFAAQIADKVASGLLSAVSVGFRPLKWERAKSADRPFGIDFSEQELLELSIVSVPANADATVIAQKSFEGNQIVNKIASLRSKRADIDDAIAIQSTPELLKELAGIDEAIKTAEELQALKAASAVPHVPWTDAPLYPQAGMTQEYSLARLLKAVATNSRCQEMDLSDSLAKENGGSRGQMIPFAISKTAVTGLLSNAGAMVGEYYGRLIERLIAPSLLSRLPITAMTLPKGSGQLMLPKLHTGTVANWIAEDSAATESNPAFGQIQLTPRRLAVYCRFSRMLLATANQAIDSVLIGDMATALSEALDTGLLSGAGIGNAPRGILSQAGTTLTEGAATNVYGVLNDALAALEAANVAGPGIAWLVSPDAMTRLRTSFIADSTDATQGSPILTTNAGLLGYPVIVSSFMPAKTILLARWSDVIAATWSSGLDTIVDPYSDAVNGNIRLISEVYCDFGIRHSESIVKITLT